VISRRSLGWLAVLLLAGGFLNPPFPRGVLHAAVFLAALVVLTVVRELGRLAVGVAVGLRPVIVEIGEGSSLFRVRAGGLLWHFKQTPMASVTIWAPPPDDLPLRARLVLLTIARPAVTLAVLLGIRALGVPLLGQAHGVRAGAWLSEVVTASEALLMLGLFPFSLRGVSIVPFESDGLKLLHIPRAKRQDLAQEFARYYFATAFEALNDGDTTRALDSCREGLAKYGPPWSEALRNIEAVVLSRAGDHLGAQAKAERDLARDLPPVARALALNSWSWFAFLQRDEAALPLADRRSADALILQPKLAAIAGTRGAILLWQGRVGEAMDLLERAHAGARSRRTRELDACLLAMAHAARGEGARAQAYLDEVRHPEQTEGLWVEAERCVSSAQGPAQVLRASRGHRTLVLGADAIELHEANRAVRRLTPSEIDRVRVGVSARGRAQLLLRTDRTCWRLPLAERDLAWARMSLARVIRVRFEDLEASIPPPAGSLSMETQERAYQERKLAQSLTVSTTKGVVFLASAVAFAASMLFLTASGKALALIMAILFVHELGHWIAMRAFGHDDARISFIPFLGAATMSKIPFEKRWQEVVMLLAGPVPGMLLGMAALLSPLAKIHGVPSAAGLLIAINALNLLPLHPLDGGRIFHALVTAGRPRLDLAFKTVATLAFLGAGIAMKEPILGTLGVFGLLFWRQGHRIAELERRIRGTPGFDTRLPEKERRAYVFRALAEEPSGPGGDWASTVAGLEMPLRYRPTPVWQLVLYVSGLALVATGAGLLATRSASRMTKRYTCPARALASPVSCAGGPVFADVAWNGGSAALSSQPAQAHAPRAIGDDEDELDEAARVGAFVWCSTPNGGTTADLAARLNEAEAGRGYCEALPWEHPRSGSEGVWRKARWTQWQLEQVTRFGGAGRLEHFDELVAKLTGSPEFDAETARQLREIVGRRASRSGKLDHAGAFAALSERLGPSPNASCERIGIHNVRQPEPGDGSGPVVTFAATLASKAEFGALAGYLCQAGCRLAVLPTSPQDRRVDTCF
jgi:Zn-dependent protease